ncbi:DUF4147 domain-containing protein [Patescibacteria group bacterium]|nr:DUF4147 domain-containing protein [Patescibacteria group bacterium]
MADIIRNSGALAVTRPREDALAIAEAAYAAVNTHGAVLAKMRIEGGELVAGELRRPISGRRIFFVGIGKCAVAGACAVETLLGERLTAGIAFDVSDIEARGLTKTEVLIGTHPEPSETNVRASGRIVAFLSECREDDLVLMLISGGGSTLLCLPDAAMTCADERTLFDELTDKGATIEELNTVRKHISKARGGGLAAAAYPAEVVSLIVSDVPGNDIEFIASGPTACDTSTVDEAKAVLARYGIAAPPDTAFIETPKDPKYFARVSNVLFLGNGDALAAMRAEAARRGYRADVAGDRIAGEARDVGERIAEALHAAEAKTALLYAGESTVKIAGAAGKGGRNQELALGALANVREDELVLPFASDGRDNTDHAGAIADVATLAHAKERNLSIADSLSAHESYTFFSETGDFLETGYTGSNVSDLIIALKS